LCVFVQYAEWLDGPVIGENCSGGVTPLPGKQPTSIHQRCDVGTALDGTEWDGAWPTLAVGDASLGLNSAGVPC